MRRFSRSNLFFITVLSLFFPRPAMSHDGWIEISPTIVEKGQVTSIALMHGNHSNEHRSYRIAGKWDRKYTSLIVVDPAGKQQVLTDRLVDLGEDDETTGPKGPKGFFLASFVASAEGLFQAIARQVRTVQVGDGPKLLTIRTARSAFAAFATPSVAAAQNLKGFDRPLSGDHGMELVPLKNPLSIYPGTAVGFELRNRGKPTVGQVVSVVRRIDGSASVQDQTTDERGRVTFMAGPADWYLARVKVDEENPRADGQNDKSSYEATYVFQVFNRP